MTRHRLARQEWGPEGGRPLVLLHALGESADDWADIAPALAADRRVLAPDLRGHGRSPWPGDYALESMAADVAGLMDDLALDRADVVGHSMGGVVAHLLAQEHPGRVARLVLEDVPVPRPRDPVPPVRPPGELPFDWGMVLAVRHQLDTPDPRWLERLPLIEAETLLLAGGPTSHVDQEGIAEFAERLPSGRAITIPVGHLIHRAAPQQFLHHVTEFLAPPGP
ncbi:alpha/beta fold hydrolase [Streptomyces sp. NPDC050085]|uniref:alpha/beta fold hydrolase n=1 Tax=Streptomyces sp. NPDC050085 TaxID=3365600 RepID=UPI0037A2DB3A